MNNTNTILLMSAIASVAIVACCVPLALQKIKPKSWYGFRTPKTLTNEKVWYEANRVAGIDMTFAGLLLFLTTAGLFLFSVTLTFMQVVVTLVIVLSILMIAALAHSFAVLRRL